MQEFSFGVIPLKIEENTWHVLLIQQHEGYWAFPKGRKELNEKPLESATRELKEETGLEIKELLFDLPIQESYSFIRKKIKIDKTVSYFIALVGGELKLQQEEILAAKWVKLENVIQELTFPEGKALCKKMIEFLQNRSLIT